MVANKKKIQTYKQNVAWSLTGELSLYKKQQLIVNMF